MKYLSLFILITFVSISGYSQTIDSLIRAYKKDTCLFNFIEYSFPQKKENNVIDTIYLKTAISNDSYFESLSTIPQKKLGILPKKKSIASDYLLDSAYYCKTMYSTNKYTLCIYKNGSKYEDEKGDEMFSPVDYIVLVTLDNNGRIIDYLIPYYYVHRLYESSERYFYMDKNNNITLINFYTDELETTFKGRCTYHINDKGRFILLPKIGEIKNSRFKKYVY